MAFNISGRNLSNVGFADELASFCQNFGVRLEWVTLELTETAAAANAANAMDILSRLRLKGCRISIDDFGTGYSSMKQLQRLPFSELKVDMEFVKGCVASAGDRIIVKAIIDLAHNLGLTAVAEGVEDQATARGAGRARLRPCARLFHQSAAVGRADGRLGAQLRERSFRVRLIRAATTITK